MAFCSKCGKELGEQENFCSTCGHNAKDTDWNKPPRTSKKWFLIVFLIVIIAIALYFAFRPTGFVSLDDLKENIDDLTSREKSPCPYECCDGDEHKKLTCSADYSCESNARMAIDSDNDGLTNIEEKEIGTNPQMYDTDGDTLSDYREHKEIGTSPTNRNTDGDRYDDDEDAEPLIKNSAEITIELTNKEWNWDYVKIAIAIFGGGIINPDMVIATPKATAVVSNVGDDYSSYVGFDLVFVLQNVEIDRQRVQLAKLNAFDSKTEFYTKDIIAGNIPDMLINLVSAGSTDWEIRVENLEYEKF